MADLTAKVLGYRYWATDGSDWTDDEDGPGGLLYSQGHRGWAWGLGVNEAQCNQTHAAPAHSCQCGLHAYFEPQEVPRRGPFKTSADQIYGCVRGWGRMEVHLNGYRAQFCEIVAIAYNDHLPRRASEWIKALARDYEVECVPLSKLTAYALEQADPMPKELLPERPTPVKTNHGGISAFSDASDIGAVHVCFSTFGGQQAQVPTQAGKALEDIGLHTPQLGDIVKHAGGGYVVRGIR